MDNRFRFIDAEGSEQSIADVPRLVGAVVEGRIIAATMLFDVRHQRWAAAANHDVFQAATVTAQTEEVTEGGSLTSRTSMRKFQVQDALSSSSTVDGRTANQAEARSLHLELRALDEEFANARLRGFDNEFLRPRYKSERSRIHSEFEAPASRTKHAESGTMTTDKQIVSSSTPRTISQQEFALLTARPETRVAFMSILMGVIGAVGGYRNSWDIPSVLLMVGATASFGGMLVFGRSIVSQKRGATVLAGLLPYLFGCYVTLAKGIYPAFTMTRDFSLTRVFAVVAFTYVGYRTVYWTWQLSEIAAAISKGRLRVE